MEASAAERNFANYQRGDNPAELAGGVLREIAAVTGSPLDERPTEQQIGDLIGDVGKKRELQENIGQVSQKLDKDATVIMADWVDRSGVLLPVERAFSDPDVPMPKKLGFVVVQSDVVVNWFLRRKDQAQRLDPEEVDEFLLVVGTRKAKPAEHPFIKTIVRDNRQAAGLVAEEEEPVPENDEEKERQKKEREKYYPPAAEYIKKLQVVEGLQAAGFNARLLETGVSKGDEVLNELMAARPELLDGTVMAIGNAPSTIQAAGQLQDAARRVDPNFNSGGEQLFMRGDTIQVARRGEKPATHQNPETALGQIVRNAKYVALNK